MSGLLTAGVLQQAANMQQKQYALSFDGVDDYVLFQDLLSGIDSVSIDITLLGIGTSGVQIPFSYRDSTTELLQLTRQSTSEFRYQIRSSLGLIKVISDYSYIQDTFVNYEMRFLRGGNKLEFYKEGVLIDSVVPDFGESTIRSTLLYLGTYYVKGLYFKGLISKLKIVNPVTQSLILDVDFSAGSGNTLFDKTANANHGTIYGATWVEL